MVASLGLLAVWKLALRLAGSQLVAFWTVVLTGLYPIWFAQSTLAHADIFAAACTLWGLVYALPDRDRKPWVAAVVVHGSRPFERDGHCHPVDPGGDGHCDRPAGGSAVAVPLVARSAVVDELCGPAGWLVCLALCKDRLPLRQS